MKLSRKLLIILLIGSISVLSLSCASKSEGSENQLVTVQRGDLRIDITAVGNLALAKTEILAFEMAGTVEEVLVNEGDLVTEGQELVKLDTSEWDKQLKALEKALVTAQRSLTAKERAVTEAESQVTDYERQVISKELAVLQAELDRQTAENNLYQTDELKSQYDALVIAKYQLSVAQATEDWLMARYWENRLDEAQEELDLKLTRLTSSLVAELSNSAALQFANAKLQLEQKQWQLEGTQIAVEAAKFALEGKQLAREYARQDVEYERSSLEDAQSTLDEAKSLSPIITAPFDGFITKVKVEGGDEVMKGTEAVYIADPNKFEAEIPVSEMDIMQVKLGGNATVQVDATSEISLPAEVTYISPTSTYQQGVVTYAVKVEVQTLEEIIQEQREAMQKVMPDISSGQIPERLQQAIQEGSITQEQAEEMMKRIQEGEMPLTSGGVQVPTTAIEGFQLKEGMTVTVSIIVEERTDVLLVPNSAITTQGSQSFVQVMLPDGTTEKRPIITGISDYQFTEVTEGLSEGERVAIPKGTTTTTTTTTTPQRGGEMRFLGPMGR